MIGPIRWRWNGSNLLRPLLLLLIVAGTALAHEFWLLPPRFFVAAGSSQNLHVFVGEDFKGERWAGKSARLTRLVQYTATDSTDLTAAATRTDTLQTTIAFPKPGLQLVALTTTNAFIELTGEKFTAYLQEDGLENVLALRRQRGETNKPGREAYRRCAKTLLLAGSVTTRDSTFARPTRQPLELIPEQNPYALKAGAALTVRVLYEGKPLPRALVQVWQRGAPGQTITRRTKLYTNQSGRVLFQLSAPGSYMVSTVCMVPATDRKTADWQSTWATFTFGFAPQRGF
ncbi:hypothetical protein SAMN00120144_2278 [Hymenobacter roseosalivarius DSM 11622]|uniref:DUF4198 domain-containing protein n=1 Tax=Hymenobacter roseosalivarius DSM 11622 TaxID=645990 RepID=A0A1W1VX22_9BACT|nr:DUF4198 domain-containing protein [Hymenobacter roseosalivarius]SMB97922.1 hypothetical protein SAMN00120144_2278 [Hymenobacter roseosalivarius DSM 11622]